MSRSFLAFLVVLVAASFGQRATAASEPRLDRELARLLSAGGALELDGRSISLEEARKFYEARDGKPAWWTPAGWSERASAAVAWLAAAGRDGLRPRDYPAALRPLPEPDAPPAPLARAELLLSASLLRYVADVQVGRRAPVDMDPDRRVSLRRVDATADLSAGLAAPDFAAWLSTLAPTSRDYFALRDALARYRSLAAGTDWPVLAEGPKLERGARDPRVITLRRQLALLGDLPEAPSSDSSFEDSLDGAVRAFQERHGLDADGAVGPATRRALNRSPADRVVQIELNMERLRWLEEDLGRRHVLVNIADFRLMAVVEGRSVFTTPVVVGRD
jgi:murein L,D-transpeptidase YcbB/YkuD